MIDQEFAKWYVNEDWKATRQAVLDRIDHISDAIQYDMKTNTRPYATRVLLLKEDLIPKPPVLTDKPLPPVPLDFCNLYPNEIDSLDKLIQVRLAMEIMQGTYGLISRRGPKHFG